MRVLGLVIGVYVFCLGPVAHAVVITHGNLTTDDTTNFITDTTSGRQYTRLDAFNLNVAGTLAAIAPGGAFEGWSVATSSVADDFIAAALGLSSTACDGPVAGLTCGFIGGWTDGDLGQSYTSAFDLSLIHI